MSLFHLHFTICLTVCFMRALRVEGSPGRLRFAVGRPCIQNIKKGGVRMKRLLVFAVLIGLVGFGHYSEAEVLTFDNLALAPVTTTSGGTVYVGSVPNGYGGLNWNAFSAIDGVDAGAAFQSGYTNGVVSPNNVAFNNYGNPSFITAGSSFGPTFNFFGGSFTGAWNDGLNVEIVGSYKGTVLYDNTIVVNTSGPTVFTTDYANITELDFISYGGTPNANFTAGYGPEFVMDNVNVPEPSILVLLGFGTAGLGLGLRRKSICRALRKQG